MSKRHYHPLQSVGAEANIRSVKLVWVNAALIPLEVIALIAIALTRDNSVLIMTALVLAVAYVVIVGVTARGKWVQVGPKAAAGLVAIGFFAWLTGLIIARSL